MFLLFRKYFNERKTQNLEVPYFVKSDFNTEFRGSLRRLEQQVEDEYISNLRTSCFKERNYSKAYIFGVFLKGEVIT